MQFGSLLQVRTRPRAPRRGIVVVLRVPWTKLARTPRPVGSAAAVEADGSARIEEGRRRFSQGAHHPSSLRFVGPDEDGRQA